MVFSIWIDKRRNEIFTMHSAFDIQYSFDFYIYIYILRICVDFQWMFTCLPDYQACHSVCCACQIINMSAKWHKPQNIMFLTFIVSDALVHFGYRIRGKGLTIEYIIGQFLILIRRKKMCKDKNGKMWMLNIHASVIGSDSMPIDDEFIGCVISTTLCEPLNVLIWNWMCHFRYCWMPFSQYVCQTPHRIRSNWNLHKTDEGKKPKTWFMVEFICIDDLMLWGTSHD